MQKKTSIFRGVYYDSNQKRWIVQLERHDHFPCFRDEIDAAIYAEYYLRKLYDESPNFPELSDSELAQKFKSVLEKRELEQAEQRSHSKQGLKKIKTTTSEFIGVSRKDDRWVVRIQYKGKQIYIASYSMNQEDAEIKAAKAYDKKALEIYGENARLNFPVTKA